MKTEMTNCVWCGEKYDSNCDGHDHFEDGSCECRYCLKTDALKGLQFCSPECEMNYIHENNIAIEFDDEYK